MKIIVYGLGKAFEEQKLILQHEFDIVAYSDRNKKIASDLYVYPKDILSIEFDYIYITSIQYYEEIKKELVCILGEGIADRLITFKDVWGEFDDQEIRDEWVKGNLQKIEAGKTLLDAGAGQMRYAQYCKHLNYISQDFGGYDPNGVNEGLQPKDWETNGINIRCDIIDMPLNNDSVDVILCTEVFEHLKDPISAVREFSRILKPDGKLLLTAPFCSITHFAPYYYANGFSKYWYTDILSDYGFEVKAITPYGNYFTWLWQEMSRVKYVSQRYCDYKMNEEILSLFDSMKLFNKLSKMDTGSDELLCAGYMAEAYKSGYRK